MVCSLIRHSYKTLERFSMCAVYRNTEELSRIIQLEYNIGNGQLSDVTGSAHIMGRYLANANVSDKS